MTPHLKTSESAFLLVLTFFLTWSLGFSAADYDLVILNG